MSGRYKILTDMTLTLVGSREAPSHEVTLELTFNAEPERSATYTQPGEGASISIQTVRVIENFGDSNLQRFHAAPDWLWPMVEADENLEREMLAEAWESDESAREYRADSIREEQMIDKFTEAAGPAQKAPAGYSKGDAG